MATRLAGKICHALIFLALSNFNRAPTDIKPTRIVVDLDAEKGVEPRAPNPAKPDERSNVHNVFIKKANNHGVNLHLIKDYLDGRSDFNNGILEAISKYELL